MFSGDIQIGDKIYSYRFDEFGRIRKVDWGHSEPIIAELDSGKIINFDWDGREGNCNNPTVFWDKLKFEIPQKPFDLKREYKKLKRKEFDPTTMNCYIEFVKDKTIGNRWMFTHVENFKMLGALFFVENQDLIDFVVMLNEKSVEVEELEKIIKEVENED